MRGRDLACQQYPYKKERLVLAKTLLHKLERSFDSVKNLGATKFFKKREVKFEFLDKPQVLDILL